ncbi:hypothetical protein EMIHUDRAFT_252046 [Emiliania huxleyi CCMP1516]|uniref:SHOCT domain-containing protein n=2 Tax=Emiliania huxleyi TaxID=2903 RepID=A0A0D3KP95_EMIH1|nr:hypothetical protein EMIHUDRAFT_252046 [Emiliania huxleyi CCMP1516]EOD37580.1 hypothetical protein EMIHUDRAFT_252046 [Emiliania huxleyi CCMP1516]|eukprot:XP_005790009.1 hypothetical protein EMIHUDRAFT_252046 [Emiliania huxleyi CCMP1516]
MPRLIFKRVALDIPIKKDEGIAFAEAAEAGEESNQDQANELHPPSFEEATRNFPLGQPVSQAPNEIPTELELIRLHQFKVLLDGGAISQEEYEIAKQKLLSVLMS